MSNSECESYISEDFVDAYSDFAYIQHSDPAKRLSFDEQFSSSCLNHRHFPDISVDKVPVLTPSAADIDADASPSASEALMSAVSMISGGDDSNSAPSLSPDSPGSTVDPIAALRGSAPSVSTPAATSHSTLPPSESPTAGHQIEGEDGASSLEQQADARTSGRHMSNDDDDDHGEGAYGQRTASSEAHPDVLSPPYDESTPSFDFGGFNAALESALLEPMPEDEAAAATAASISPQPMRAPSESLSISLSLRTPTLGSFREQSPAARERGGSRSFRRRSSTVGSDDEALAAEVVGLGSLVPTVPLSEAQTAADVAAGAGGERPCSSGSAGLIDLGSSAASINERTADVARSVLAAAAATPTPTVRHSICNSRFRLPNSAALCKTAVFDGGAGSMSSAGPGLALPAVSCALAINNAHNGPVLASALSPDGRWLVTGGADGAVKVWSVEDGPTFLRAARTLTGHSAPVSTLAWPSSGAAIFASASADHTVRLWHVNRPEHFFETQFPEKVSAICFSPLSETVVVVATVDGLVHSLDLGTAAQLAVVQVNSPPTSLVADADTGLLVIGSRLEVVVCTLSSLRRIAAFHVRSRRGRRHAPQVVTDVCMAGPALLMVTSQDSRVRFYDLTQCAHDARPETEKITGTVPDPVLKLSHPRFSCAGAATAGAGATAAVLPLPLGSAASSGHALTHIAAPGDDGLLFVWAVDLASARPARAPGCECVRVADAGISVTRVHQLSRVSSVTHQVICTADATGVIRVFVVFDGKHTLFNCVLPHGAA